MKKEKNKEGEINGIVSKFKSKDVKPKSQLDYLAKVLGVKVTYQDFPQKGNKSEFFSLVTLSTNPPQVREL